MFLAGWSLTRPTKGVSTTSNARREGRDAAFAAFLRAPRCAGSGVESAAAASCFNRLTSALPRASAKAGSGGAVGGTSSSSEVISEDGGPNLELAADAAEILRFRRRAGRGGARDHVPRCRSGDTRRLHQV